MACPFFQLSLLTLLGSNVMFKLFARSKHHALLNWLLMRCYHYCLALRIIILMKERMGEKKINQTF